MDILFNVYGLHCSCCTRDQLDISYYVYIHFFKTINLENIS